MRCIFCFKRRAVSVILWGGADTISSEVIPMNKTVFIDGQAGTTGLQIHERLKSIQGLEVITPEAAKRKDLQHKVALARVADLTVACLPDDASAALAAQLPDDVRLLDASTAFRTHPDWVYGLPEMQPQQRQAISASYRVSNPGCYPSATILMLKPLVAAGLLPLSAEITITAESGYTGGGKTLIAAYEVQGGLQRYPGARPYALGLNHKHLPEMQHYLGLTQTPVFMPAVGAYAQGMLVQIPLRSSQLTQTLSVAALYEILLQYYADEPLIKIRQDHQALTDQGYLDPGAWAGQDDIELCLFGHDDCFILTARLDNLGKGAAGVALQNIALMLNLENEYDGLHFET